MENENEKVKNSSKKLIIGIAAAVVIIGIGIVAWILYSSSMSYVAKVNSQKITKQEYMVFSKFNMSQFLTSVAKSTTTADKYDWSTKINGETAKDQVKKSTLDSIQEIKIQLLKAKEAGITLSADDLKSVDDVINQRITDSGSRTEAEKAVQGAYGVSLSEYKEVYKDLVLSQKYISTERNKITVSDDEVKKYFDDNKKEFDKVTVTHILISTLDANKVPVSEGKKQEAKQKAEDLLKQVQAGADIKALAEKYSDDKPAVTTNKGEYTFSKGEMVAEFEKWSFSDHKPGDAGIVETQYGYHVIQFQKREESKFDDVKESIKSSLVNSKFSNDFMKKMDGWKKESQYAIVKNESTLNKVDKSIYGV